MVRVVVAVVFIVLLYVGGNIGYATLTDFQPPAVEDITVNKAISRPMTDSIYRVMIWNIGYAGLGAEQDFFYDGGTTVRPTEAQFNSYLKGIQSVVAANGDQDFILLQEVDTNSRRSYYFNELEAIALKLPYHNNAYATNYHVDYVSMPLETPWDVLGRVRAGLATFARYQPVETQRHQFPGKYDWPKRVFMLDRCFLAERFTLANGKDLLILNTHNSAYDNGSLKKAEMEALRTFVLDEYGKGNYVVVGGDWNQTPPGYDNSTFAKAGDTYEQGAIAYDYLPQGWQFVYDDTYPTNRKLAKPYNPDSTFATVIDFYLLSPNIDAVEVRTGNLEFKYSDHQPVYLKIQLKQD